MLVERTCMGIAYRPVTLLAATAVLSLSVSLGGCATSTASSSLMDARAEVPPPRKPTAYLPVEEQPPNREMMKADEQSKLKKELIAARDRQAVAAKASDKSTEALRTQPINQPVRQ